MDRFRKWHGSERDEPTDIKHRVAMTATPICPPPIVGSQR